LRDSIVLDSMTRLVNTGSLYRLYRQALEPPGVTLSLMTEVSCEEVRLMIGFGSVPARRAIHAVEDTMYRDRGIRDGMGYYIAHAPAEGIIEGGRSRCGPYPPAAPKAIGATRLDTELRQKPHAPRTRKTELSSDPNRSARFRGRSLRDSNAAARGDLESLRFIRGRTVAIESSRAKWELR
jgi:hypothetical protein